MTIAVVRPPYRLFVPYVLSWRIRRRAMIFFRRGCWLGLGLWCREDFRGGIVVRACVSVGEIVGVALSNPRVVAIGGCCGCLVV
jgi:hypothetical protein